MPKTYFITGASGFLGQEILRLLAEGPENMIYCFLRESGKKEFSERWKEVLEGAGLDDDGRVVPVKGDLREQRLGLDPEQYDRIASEITNIIHSAADVRFNQPVEKIRHNNVTGTKNIIDLAAAATKAGETFSHLDYVSTAFVAGRHSDVRPENELVNGLGFRNTYEQSKFEAEDLVRRSMNEVPAIIHRPSIVLGFSEDGRARSRNVIYPMLKLFRKWRFPVVSALPRTRLDLVPVDFVAKAIVHISSDPKNIGSSFHLAAGPEGDITLGEFLGILEDEFDKRVIVMPPSFWRYVVRPLLKTFKKDFYQRSTGVFRAFESYIWEENPRYSVEATRRALAGSGIELPDSEDFIRTCLRYAVNSDFGKSEARAD